MIERIAVIAAGLCAAAVAVAEPDRTLLDWTDLQGWEFDDHDAALNTFIQTCGDIDDTNWAAICAVAQTQAKTPGSGRAFFEMFFRPVLIEDGNPALFTAYYEPELDGTRTQTGTHRWPIYRKPPEVRSGVKWYTRGEIEDYRLLQGRGLEIAWIDDPVDVFFLQVQGSGRIRLSDGTAIRVGFGGRNGHEYRSIGAELVRRGLFERHQVSAGTIRNWVRNNPVEGARLLHHNPSFIFFREVFQVPADAGPLGAMNRSITAMRSIAVDRDHVPMGAPVWIEKQGQEPLNRLTIAQDTGAAIKGAQRADIFFGTGAEAGRRAGRIRDGGRMAVLLPIEVALAFAQDS
ncbi:MAG: MltA domain-containing protein [Pseudomonadota bacterium]